MYNFFKKTVNMQEKPKKSCKRTKKVDMYTDIRINYETINITTIWN